MYISRKCSASYLYSLEPMNVGTPMVECLMSYLGRLALAHNVELTKLTAHIIALHPCKRSLYPKQFVSVWGNSSFYGTGKTTTMIAESLELLTLQKGFKYMTMLTWKEVIHNRMFSFHKKWCPECFDEWSEVNKVIYEPLMWYLNNTNVCLRHKRKLEYLCPNPKCEKSQSNKIDYPGYCYRCGNWLGQKEYKFLQKEHNLTERDEWINRSIGELLKIAPYVIPPTIELVCSIIEGNTRKFFQGNQKEFCSVTDIHPISLRAILRRSQKRLPLRALLLLSYYTRTPLLELMGVSYKDSNE
ncbi:TniQ family protein [Bacillus toyonensis]|uniref:TniQ family protein n=1 Tax=Bacillus toyonensis TaxID=155322 RepID=UPI003016031C